MKKPIVVVWAILLLLALTGVIHYWHDRMGLILNLVLVAISGFGLLKERKASA